jgi:hypothetical protein
MSPRKVHQTERGYLAKGQAMISKEAPGDSAASLTSVELET